MRIKNAGCYLLRSDCRRGLPIASGIVQTVITSPPYWGLRDYGTAQWMGGDPACDHAKVADPVKAVATSTLVGGKKTTGHLQEGFKSQCGRCGAIRVDAQIGLEPTPDQYVARMVDLFRDVRRVLRDDGTVWLNLGDSYAGLWGNQGRKSERGKQRPINGPRMQNDEPYPMRTNTGKVPSGLKEKDLIGIPWRVALALQADGWWLRSDIIWAKPNPMPESVEDRPTRSHEYLFLLSKSPDYFYDADAIRDPLAESTKSDRRKPHSFKPGWSGNPNVHGEKGYPLPTNPDGRNKRSVWNVAPRPYPGAHFATFPPDLIIPCVKAGSRPGDLVLDPFNGSGTTGEVSLSLGRRYIGADLSAKYLRLATRRINRPHARAERSAKLDEAYPLFGVD